MYIYSSEKKNTSTNISNRLLINILFTKRLNLSNDKNKTLDMFY